MARDFARLTRQKLDEFVQLRNVIAHRGGPRDTTVTKRDAERGLALIDRLADLSVNAADVQLSDATKVILLGGPRCATTHQTTADGIGRMLFATCSAVSSPTCSCLIGRILKQGCLACSRRTTSSLSWLTVPGIAAKLREPVPPQIGLDAEPDHLVPVVTTAAPGMRAEVRYVLEDWLSEWIVHYSKRGLESGLQSVAPEDLACRRLADMLLADPTTRKP
jgi:hypothetical protein